MKIIAAFAAAGLLASMAMGAAGYALGVDAPAPQAAAETGDRAQIEAIVRDYLISNPEIMIEVQQALETRQQESQRLAQSATIEEAAGDIFNASYDGVVGNPDGNVTIVEFFDYNCGYCKHALSDMQALVEENPDLRFVMKEFPILGPDSQRAHVVSMAFRNLLPDNYAGFHEDLLGSEGRVDEAEALRIALAHGADEAALRQEMENPEILDAFQRTYELADQLAITGTPSYVVGEEVVFGALGRDVLAEKVEAMRQENTQ